jgi:hypothetical protein
MMKVSLVAVGIFNLIEQGAPIRTMNTGSMLNSGRMLGKWCSLSLCCRSTRRASVSLEDGSS